MGLGSTVRTILLADPTVSGLVGGTRIFPKLLPQSPPLPAITYQRVSRIGVADHLEGPGTLARPRVQVDSWANTNDAAEALGAAVKARLNGFKGVVVGEGDVHRIALETEAGLFDAEFLCIGIPPTTSYGTRRFEMALSAGVNVTLSGQHTNPLDFNTASLDLARKMVQSFTNGTGLNQVSKCFTDTRAVTTGATDSMDLNGGSLVDAFGVTLVFATVKALIIRASASNTTILTILGNAAAVPFLNTAATTIPLTPGGIFVYTNPSIAGTVVTAATGDIIQVVNAAGATANYDICILGT